MNEMRKPGGGSRLAPRAARRPHRALGALAALALLGAALLLLGAATKPAAKPAASKRAEARPRGPQPDFSLYQQLLNDHLWTVSEPGQPLATRFNYELFYDERGRAERTFRIRRQFLEVDPAKMDAKTRRAWAINFYNFLVIEQITDHLLIPNKVRQRHLSVQDIKPEGEDFFAYRLVKIDTTRYSLQSFERHFLFEDYDAKPGSPRPASLDPRAHFALVPGALGAPPLQQRAFRPESLDRQLDHAVRATLASPHHFRNYRGVRSIQMSAIFFRHAADFGGASQFLVAWALPFVPRTIRAQIDSLGPPLPSPGQTNWDWKLNQVVGWRFHYQMEKPVPAGMRRDSL